jgi:hypothetical protein
MFLNLCKSVAVILGGFEVFIVTIYIVVITLLYMYTIVSEAYASSILKNLQFHYYLFNHSLHGARSMMFLVSYTQPKQIMSVINTLLTVFHPNRPSYHITVIGI